MWWCFKRKKLDLGIEAPLSADRSRWRYGNCEYGNGGSCHRPWSQVPIPASFCGAGLSHVVGSQQVETPAPQLYRHVFDYAGVGLPDFRSPINFKN